MASETRMTNQTIAELTSRDMERGNYTGPDSKRVEFGTAMRKAVERSFLVIENFDTQSQPFTASIPEDMAVLAETATDPPQQILMSALSGAGGPQEGGATEGGGPPSAGSPSSSGKGQEGPPPSSGSAAKRGVSPPGAPPVESEIILPNRAVSAVFEVEVATTLMAAQRLAGCGHYSKVGILNFASAKNPGGGWYTGASAQEESLARSSSLIPAIEQFEAGFYQYNKKARTMLYTSRTIVSPDVPFFKDDVGHYLPSPYAATVVSIPAPNAGIVMQREGRFAAGHIKGALEERIDRALWLFAQQGCDAIVLGAYGCGVFKNDPQLVAGIFKRWLSQRFCGQFAHITFSILDPGMAATFAEVFASPLKTPPLPFPPPAPRGSGHAMCDKGPPRRGKPKAQRTRGLRHETGGDWS